MSQIAVPKWDIKPEDAVKILQNPQNHGHVEVCEALHVLDTEEIFTKISPPGLHVTLPKQKALKRITTEILLRSPLVFKPTTKRVDHTVAINKDTGEIYQIYPQHTRDGFTDLRAFEGAMSYQHGGKEVKIPHVALVGYDGFVNERLSSGMKSIAVTSKLQTSVAEFVVAAQKQEDLEALKDQKVIIVAKSYAEIFKDWLQKTYPEASPVIREVEGGSEGRVAVTPGANLVVDITDSGKSLLENGFEFVLPISRAAPVLVRHVNLEEQFEQAVADRVEDLSQVLREASQKAFPNAQVFEPSRVIAEQERQISRIQDEGITSEIQTIPDFLKSAGKNGERDKPSEQKSSCQSPEGYEFPYGVKPGWQQRLAA